jgi:hypothetical protein
MTHELLPYRDFCRGISNEFLGYWPASASGQAWRELAYKVERCAAGEPVTFTALDVELVKSLQLVVLRDPLAAGAKDKAQKLSRLLAALRALQERER